jgi:hypothetical protein
MCALGLHIGTLDKGIFDMSIFYTQAYAERIPRGQVGDKTGAASSSSFFLAVLYG